MPENEDTTRRACRVLCVSGSRADKNYQRPVFEALEASDWAEAEYVGLGIHEDHNTHTPVTVATDMSRAMREAARLLYSCEPDIVIVVGDRWEILAAVHACTLAGVPVAHIAGGARTEGAYDDVFRRQIEVAAEIHFPLCEEDAGRLEYDIKVGRVGDAIHVSGSPALDLAAQSIRWLNKARKGREGIFVAAYPETATGTNISNSVGDAVFGFTEEVLWLSDNPDVGARTRGSSLPSEEYYRRLSTARVCVGNSSSFVLEAPFFGTPVVLVGDRQKGRHLCDNIIQVPNDPQAIREGVEKQLAAGPYEPSSYWGSGDSAGKIAECIERWWEARS